MLFLVCMKSSAALASAVDLLSVSNCSLMWTCSVAVCRGSEVGCVPVLVGELVLQSTAAH